MDSRRTVRRVCAIVALALTVSGTASAKPKESKDDAASRLEQKALRSYVAGDLTPAFRLLDQALKMCESTCSAKTKAHLHVSLGTVRGVGEGDYAAAKREFTLALQLDPEAKLRTVTTPELATAFEEAKKIVAAEKPPEKEPEKQPDKQPDVSDLFHGDDSTLSPVTKNVDATVPPDVKPIAEPRYNWLSARAVFDFGYIADANICSPGAPAGYYCTDEKNAPYTGHPQPNNDVSRGLAPSTARFVLGYERLLFGGFTLGAFVGVGLPFGTAPIGRSAASPFSGEARATYTFGDAPFVDPPPSAAVLERLHPFVTASLGMQEVDTHVKIRVNEVPCTSTVAQACGRDLNAFRLSTGLFTTLGVGVRYQLAGRHALRAAVRGIFMFGDSTFVVSPELAYEFGI